MGIATLQVRPHRFLTPFGSFSNVNYSVKEYANDVVYQTNNICDEAGIDCPNIISESGRATVAHYSWSSWTRPCRGILTWRNRGSGSSG
jgi:hypothetical protein